MIYIFRRQLSDGARELAVQLGGRRWRNRVKPIEEQVKAGDVVVCWGESLADRPGVRILNGAPVQNKYQDALKLTEKGVPTITVARQRPAARPLGVDENALKGMWGEAVEAAEDFVEVPYARQNPAFAQGVQELKAKIAAFEQAMRQPPQLPGVAEAWLAREADHVGGRDLLAPPAAPDFWVRKENIVEEIRIHSFNGKSIRAGIKRQREGVANPHVWIRSYDAGWSIVYDNYESKKAQRDLAHAAVAALGLTFGAVDLAKKADGTWVVLEVNRAPGLEGNTIRTYAEAIKAWIQNPVAAPVRAAA
jgi:hypothetical protein